MMSGGGRIDYLDGWRGTAIALVLISHFFRIQWIDAGRLGVDLFFVLSGLLMSRILFEKRTPLSTFYRRRLSRIFPAFALYVLIIFLIGPFFGVGLDLTELFATLGFFRTYIQPHIWHAALPIHHLWSLNAEEHCYLVLGVVASIAFLRRREGWVLLLLGVLSLVALECYIRNGGPPGYELRTESVAAALMLSAAYRRFAPRVPVRTWMPVTALLVAICCYVDGAPWQARPFLAPIMLAFAVNHIDAGPRWLVGALKTRSLCWLGVCSYSLYLWQQPFYQYREVIPFSLACAIAVGAASFYLFERPLRNWLNSRWSPPDREPRLMQRPALSE